MLRLKLKQRGICFCEDTSQEMHPVKMRTVKMKTLAKQVSGLLLVAIIYFSGWLTPVSAATPNPRLIQLEFEVSSLSNQVAQLQSRVDRNFGTVVENRPVEPFDTPLPSDLSIGAQFDNLATLVIEINQRVMALEQQFSEASP